MYYLICLVCVFVLVMQCARWHNFIYLINNFIIFILKYI